MTVRKKLTVAFAALLALIVVLSYVVLSGFAQLNKSFANVVDRRAMELYLAGKFEGDIWALRATNRGILLGGYLKSSAKIAASKEDWDKSLADANKVLDQLMSFADSPQAQNEIREAKASLTKIAPLAAEVLRMCQAGEFDQAAQYSAKEITPPISLAVKLAAQTVPRHRKLLEEEKVKAAHQASVTRWITAGFIVLTLAVGIAAIFSLRLSGRDMRNLISQLEEGSAQVANAATQVSSSSQALAQGASEQAATLEETSSSTEEISSMTHKNADNSKDSATLMIEMAGQIAEGNQKLNQLVASMNEINASSEKISKIIRTIDEIAFQTNILALNAAVEAARAGEAGMGFAVVADEVRNLAQRCAQAAKDTASLIEDSVAKSNEGGRRVDEVTKAIVAITQNAEKVKVLVDEVSVGSHEQARGLDQVSKAIAQMEQVTQKTASSAEESAAAGEELNTQSATLRKVVGNLVALVGAGGKNAG